MLEISWRSPKPLVHEHYLCHRVKPTNQSASLATTGHEKPFRILKSHQQVTVNCSKMWSVWWRDTKSPECVPLEAASDRSNRFVFGWELDFSAQAETQRGYLLHLHNAPCALSFPLCCSFLAASDGGKWDGVCLVPPDHLSVSPKGVEE